MRIGVLADSASWHFQDLRRAAGGTHELVSLKFETLAASFSTDGDFGRVGFRGKGNDLQRFDRIIVRTMQSGSLQQIIFRMDLLARLQSAGIRIVNSPRAIEISVDKYLSLAMLADEGIATPATCVAQDFDAAMNAFVELGGDVLYKPIFGSMGNGIERISSKRQAAELFQREIAAGEVIYLQKFIEHGDWDVRVLVIGHHIVSMKRRRPGHWLTNVAQGAAVEEHDPTEVEIATAKRVATIVGCEIAGIDLIYHRGDNHPVVVDVNAAPGWAGISQAVGKDIAAMIVDQVCRPL